ncbi:hypothetical protein KY317_02595 [Candidatus Woesearchaeota archaeon]|nr:hypothetical protein [Candidatus Woesearchaeota archaeon]
MVCRREIIMKYNRLDNPHSHPDKEDISGLLFHLVSNTDFCSITNWNHNRFGYALKPKDLERLADSNPREFEIKRLGNSTYTVSSKGRKTILYVSQEIRTEQGAHITAECCDRLLEAGQDMRKTIELIKKNNGKAILEHPFTRYVPVYLPFLKHMQYSFVFDGKYRNELREAVQMVDGVEVFNSMNTWWQFPSNLFAKEFVRKAGYRNGAYLPMLAGGDEHHDYKSIGRVGNLLPELDLSGLTGDEIQEFRWDNYKKGNFKRKEKLTRLYAFFKGMMVPIIKRKLLGDVWSFKQKEKII